MEKPVADRRWTMLGVLFLARLAMAVQFQSVAALGPLMIEAGGVDLARLGTLVGAFMLPGVALALPGGLLGQRFGDRRMAVLGLALMVAGGAGVALGDSFGPLLAARIVCGAGAVLMNVVLTKMAMDWFAGREIAAAMALLVSSWPIGIGLALLVMPGLAALGSTAGALAATAVLAGLALAAMLGVYRPRPGLAPAPAAFAIRLSGREWRLTIAAGLVWAFYNVGFILLPAFGPSLLAAAGAPLGRAGAVVSVVTWLCAVSVPLGGVLAARARAPDLTMGASFAALALLSVAFAAGAPPVAVCLAFGLVAGLPAGLIMALTSEALRPENRTAGVGVFFTAYYALMAAMVPLAGLAGDLSGSPSAPLLVGAGAMIVAGAALAAFRILQRGP